MAGTFLLGERKVRPGVYYRYERAGYEVAGADNGILAVLYQGDWGALNKAVDYDATMLNELADYAGTGAAIIREGLIGGATTVRAVRVGSEGACGKLKLKAASGSEELVELSARFEGTKEFTVSVRTDLITGSRQLLIYSGSEVFQSVSFSAGGDEAQGLVDGLATNRFFVAKKLKAGVLADVTQGALSGGANPTVTNASYDKGTNVLERYRWNVIVADSDEAAVKTMLAAFVKQSYETGRLGIACLAGQSSQKLEDRVKYAASLNDEKIVYVLNSWVGNDGTVYDGYLAAARIGGMIAGSETNVSLTHDVVANAIELPENLTNGEVIDAEQKGCLVLTLNSQEQIWVDSAINTLVSLNSSQDAGWKKIRRTKCRFELISRITETHDRLIGNVSNDYNGRATIVAAAQRVINEMVGEGKLVQGSYVEEDEAHPAEGDSIWLKLNILDIDSAEKIYSTYVFRFSQSFDSLD